MLTWKSRLVAAVINKGKGQSNSAAPIGPGDLFSRVAPCLSYRTL